MRGASRRMGRRVPVARGAVRGVRRRRETGPRAGAGPRREPQQESGRGQADAAAWCTSASCASAAATVREAGRDPMRST